MWLHSGISCSAVRLILTAPLKQWPTQSRIWKRQIAAFCRSGHGFPESVGMFLPLEIGPLICTLFWWWKRASRSIKAQKKGCYCGSDPVQLRCLWANVTLWISLIHRVTWRHVPLLVNKHSHDIYAHAIYRNMRIKNVIYVYTVTKLSPSINHSVSSLLSSISHDCRLAKQQTGSSVSSSCWSINQ